MKCQVASMVQPERTTSHMAWQTAVQPFTHGRIHSYHCMPHCIGGSCISTQLPSAQDASLALHGPPQQQKGFISCLQSPGHGALELEGKGWYGQARVAAAEATSLLGSRAVQGVELALLSSCRDDFRGREVMGEELIGLGSLGCGRGGAREVGGELCYSSSSSARGALLQAGLETTTTIGMALGR